MISAALFFDSLHRRDMTVRAANFLNDNGIHSLGQLASLSRATASSLKYTDESGQRHTMDPPTFRALHAILKSSGLKFGLTLDNRGRRAVEKMKSHLLREKESLRSQLRQFARPIPPSVLTLLAKLNKGRPPRPPMPPISPNLPELKYEVASLKKKLKRLIRTPPPSDPPVQPKNPG
jgi:hypothetical protein